MNKAVIYIHGQGGNAEEVKHYETLFENYDVIGWDYDSETPWEAKDEFPKLFDSVSGQYETVILIANSIGAFFAMNSLAEKKIDKAFFISPVVDMEQLIGDMMMWANVTEDELRSKGVIKTSFGQELSWEYLSYVRMNRIDWKIPTHILYGSNDNLTSIQTISEFANKTDATFIVMEGGEHWFHTEGQMQFLDEWIKSLM